MTPGLRDHWWWRPGWRPDRRFYTWHLTFEGQEPLHRLVEAYQSALADLDGFDLIPVRWLHLTTQGIGFTDEIGRHEADAIANEAAHSLRDLPAVDLTFHRPVARHEALAFPPHPAGAVHAVRAAIRDAIATVRGPDNVPEAADQFQPHLSFAYVNTDQPAEPVLAALAEVDLPAVTVTVPAASLIVLQRDGHLYRWETLAQAPFS